MDQPESGRATVPIPHAHSGTVVDGMGGKITATYMTSFESMSVNMGELAWNAKGSE